MRIAVESTNGVIKYINFDLVSDFWFRKEPQGKDLNFYYESATNCESWSKIIISKKEKNKILNKLGL
jgi:hypothetical protein